jgi:hypothetical protein
MHDHRELACYRHASTFGAAAAGYGHTPCAELRGLTAARYQRRRRLIEQMTEHMIASFADMPGRSISPDW